MNWETGVFMAEIASALGVIITLGYLAYQISQTNRIGKAAVARELQQKYSDIYDSNHAVSRIILLSAEQTKGSAGRCIVLNEKLVCLFNQLGKSHANKNYYDFH